MDLPKEKTKRDISIWEAMSMTWDILVTVLVLTTLFAVGGILLDRYYQTKFIFTIIGFVLLIALGYKIILKKAKKIAKRMETPPNS